MIFLVIQIFFALVAVVCAEPPSYSYLPPSNTYGAPSISSSYGAPSHGLSSYASGYTHYEQRPVGYSTSEGLHVDPHLLNKIKHVLIAHENSGSAGGFGGGHGGHGGHGISSTYGVPSPVYGVPSQHYRTTDLHFGDVWQSNAVAYYVGKESRGHGGGGGYVSQSYGVPAPAPVYSRPSQSYGIPKISHISTSYGAPKPRPILSSTYGAPHY